MTFFTKICIVFLCNFLIINSGLYTLSLNSYCKKDILFFDLTVAVHEAVYATSRVYKLALTCIEGVRGA